MSFQCRFIDGNKCTIVMGDVGSGGKVCMWWWGAGSLWKLSVLSGQFCCEPKTALKNKVLFLKNGQRNFPGGTVIKNPPANAGDVGSSPGPGRSHMLRSN